MYIIAHKLYEAQKRASRLLIQCGMDHQQCFEHVVTPEEGATCGGREGKWYGGGLALHGVRGHPTPSQRHSYTLQSGGKRMREQSGIRGVLNHLRCHVLSFSRSSLRFYSPQVWVTAQQHFAFSLGPAHCADNNTSKSQHSINAAYCSKLT